MKFFLLIVATSLTMLSCSSSEKVTNYIKDTNKSIATHAKSVSKSVNANLVSVGLRLGIIDIVGNWGTDDDSHIVQFGKDGKGFFIEDRTYNGNTYSYYKDFKWSKTDNTIKVNYTMETSIRNGTEIIREKTISENTVYKILNGTLYIEDIVLHKK